MWPWRPHLKLFNWDPFVLSNQGNSTLDYKYGYVVFTGEVVICQAWVCTRIVVPTYKLLTTTCRVSFGITGPLWEESNCHQWIPLTKDQWCTSGHRKRIHVIRDVIIFRIGRPQTSILKRVQTCTHVEVHLGVRLLCVPRSSLFTDADIAWLVLIELYLEPTSLIASILCENYDAGGLHDLVVFGLQHITVTS